MASSNSDDILPPLTDEDIQTYVNKRTCDKIIPDVFSVIIAWGSTKRPDETFEDYIRRRNQISEDSDEWKKILKNFYSDERNKLKSKSSDSFDTTFCCKLLPHICNDIEKMGSDVWKTNDESKIECLLKKLKERRNAVMHEPKDAAIEKGIEDEVLRLSLKLLEVAGQKYGVSSVDDEKKKLKEEFNAIKTRLLSKEKRLWRIRRKLLTDGKTDMREKHLQFEQDKPAEFKHIDKFYPLEMTSAFEGGLKKTFPCTDLFSEMEEYCPSTRVFIIKGGGGSGKSSMIAQMESQILGCNSSSTFKKIEAFDMCLRVNCRESSYETLGKFIQDSFSSARGEDDPSRFSDCGTKLSGDDMKDALRLMNLLLFIDGMDELNAKSAQLVRQIIGFLKINQAAKCIVTSRPHSTEKVTDILDQEGIPYQAMEIEELRSRAVQEVFLKSICTNGDEASKAFAELDLDLSCPVHLALFGHFCSLDPTSVNSWTSSIQMMKNTLSLNSKSAEKTLENEGFRNADLIVKKILYKTCRASFISLYIGKLYLQKKFYEAIKESSFDSLGPNIPYDRILSCFLKPSKSHREPSYQFYHKTHQELMAGTYMAKKIAEDRTAYFTSWNSLLQQIFEKAKAEEPLCNVLQEEESQPTISSEE